jgi:hypothetical protein
VQDRYGRSILASFHGWWSLAGISGTLANAGTARLGWSLSASLVTIAAIGLVLALIAGPGLLRHAQIHAHRPPAATDGAQPAAATDGANLAAAIDGAEPAGSSTAGPNRRAVLALGVAVMLVFIGESSTSNWSGVLLQQALHASASVVPLGLGAYLACQLLGRTVADRIVGRFGAGAAVAGGSVIGALGFAGVAAANRPWLVIVAFAVVGTGLCVVVPLSFSAAGALDRPGGGAVIARVNLFNYLGFVVGSALIGPIAEGAGLRWAFVVPGVLVLGIVALSRVFAVDGVRWARASIA